MKIIFISYMNRSGSSFLCNELSKAKEFCVCPEADILFDIFCWKPLKRISKKKWKSIIRIIANDLKFKMWEIGIYFLNNIETDKLTRWNIFILILYEYQRLNNPKAKFIVFKHPEISHLKGFPIEPFSDVYFIHLLRDPRAVFYSQKNAFAPVLNTSMSDNCLTTAHEYKSYYKKIITGHFKSKVIKYEDLISEYQKTIAELQEFFNPGSPVSFNVKGNYKDKIISTNQHLHKNLDEKPDTGRIKAWENQLTDLEVSVIEKYCHSLFSDSYYKKSELNMALTPHKMIYLIRGYLKFLYRKKDIVKRNLERFPL